ncbi:MAG: polyphosphate polymerase domain-containing protein [Flavobacteriales bacterium]|nr:polyphosphate polymerase domain-containing protein [Flavobacteriales bacterium]MCB0793496.1 polyphosphate polymerase domain-containing protein [Flavobacteriales bacterium]
MQELDPIIARFDPISLDEMDAVSLMDRTDTKYVFAKTDLPHVLEEVLPHYRILEVKGKRGTDYRSLYYDTEELKSYMDHHNGRNLRYKVRYREYVGSGICFLEVKRKTGRGRTDKVRIPVPGIPEEMPAADQAFVREASGDQADMQATLWNSFTRLTLVRRDRPERLTIDLGLRFAVPSDETQAPELEGTVVAEVKQERTDRSSPFVQCMRRMGLRPKGMSKYCIGMLRAGQVRKYNRFKPTLNALERIASAA